MIMIVASGMSTPTSITVVATSILIFHSLKACMTASLSLDFIFPCMSHT